MCKKNIILIIFLMVYFLVTGVAIQKKKKYWVKATAYIAYGKVASEKPQPHGIASNFLPIGSKIKIARRISKGEFPDGFDHTKIFVVDDCMGKPLGKKVQGLDFRLKHEKNAYKFGVSTLEVEIVELGKGRNCF